MLGFAPLSSTPLSALPATGPAPGTTSLGLVTHFGTPAFGATVQASTVGKNTRFGAPPLFGPTLFQTFGRGADGDTTFLDDSPYYAPITRNGSIAKSTAQSRFGSGSIALTGATTGNNLTVAPHSRYRVGDGSFTIETEVYLNAYNASGGWLLGSGGGATDWFAANGIYWVLQSNADGVVFSWLWYGFDVYWGFYVKSVAATVPLNTWAQIKVTYDGTTVRLFVDGTLAGSLSGFPLTLYGSGSAPVGLSVGSIYGIPASTTNAANAYLQDIRIRRDCTDIASFSAPTEGLKGWIGAVPTQPAAPAVPAPVLRMGQPVSGLLAPTFGTGFGANYQRPTGFTSVVAGAPRIFPFSPPPALPVQFGLARLFPFHVAPGIRAVISSPIFGQQYWKALATTPRALFGTPTTPTNRNASARGISATRIGAPFSSGSTTEGVGTVCRAVGWPAAVAGAPAARWHLTGAATPVNATQLGAAHVAHRIYRTSAIPPGATFGTPRAGTGRHQITGLRPTHAGWPLAIMTLRASALQPKYKAGTPVGIRPGASLAVGFAPVRAGQPTGLPRHNYRASGCYTTVFGAPGFRQRHRVAQIAPGTTIPTPLLKRITQC